MPIISTIIARGRGWGTVQELKVLELKLSIDNLRFIHD
jgi:hypothetical protein